MGTTTVTVSSKGQIAIPKAVREKIGLQEGTRLRLSVEGDTMVLRKYSEEVWRKWEGRFPNSRMLEDLEREHREEVERDEALKHAKGSRFVGRHGVSKR
jgi:AbrB family looped-hinge helix DNA binding protein